MWCPSKIISSSVSKFRVYAPFGLHLLVEFGSLRRFSLRNAERIVLSDSSCLYTNCICICLGAIWVVLNLPQSIGRSSCSFFQTKYIRLSFTTCIEFIPFKQYICAFRFTPFGILWRDPPSRSYRA